MQETCFFVRSFIHKQTTHLMVYFKVVPTILLQVYTVEHSPYYMTISHYDSTFLNTCACSMLSYILGSTDLTNIIRETFNLLRPCA